MFRAEHIVDQEDEPTNDPDLLEDDGEDETPDADLDHDEDVDETGSER